MAYGRVQMPTNVRSRSALRIVALGLLLILPFAEAWLLAFVAGQIGLWPTVGLVITTSLVGLVLLVTQGQRSWRSLIAALREGRMPSRELADTTLVLIGGIVLLLPGLLTDVLGLALLVPPTRVLIRRLLGAMLARQVTRERTESGIISGEAEPATDATDDGVIVGRLMH